MEEGWRSSKIVGGMDFVTSDCGNKDMGSIETAKAIKHRHRRFNNEEISDATNENVAWVN